MGMAMSVRAGLVGEKNGCVGEGGGDAAADERDKDRTRDQL